MRLTPPGRRSASTRPIDAGQVSVCPGALCLELGLGCATIAQQAGCEDRFSWIAPPKSRWWVRPGQHGGHFGGAGTSLQKNIHPQKKDGHAGRATVTLCTTTIRSTNTAKQSFIHLQQRRATTRRRVRGCARYPAIRKSGLYSRGRPPSPADGAASAARRQGMGWRGPNMAQARRRHPQRPVRTRRTATAAASSTRVHQGRSSTHQLRPAPGSPSGCSRLHTAMSNGPQ